MANNEIASALISCGFEANGMVYFGTWRDYAVSLRSISGKTYYADFAVRLGKVTASLRRSLAKAVRVPGLKLGGLERVTNQVVTFSLSLNPKGDVTAQFRERMDQLAAALRNNGVFPADTCILTGAPMPDSLCLASVGGLFCYQPAMAAALREQSERVREQAEDNRENGSYLTGLVGALLGMLVGLIPNLLSILFLERIYGLLFALVPMAAMFGYKLMKGKMSKAALWIVIGVSLLGVILIPLFELAYYMMHDNGSSFGLVVATVLNALEDGSYFSIMAAEYLQLLLFMGIGILVAWRYIFSQLSSSAVNAAQIQIDTLRPNPLRRQPEQY